MPRNGDGSGDSGPYEGHEIVHGTNGDVCRVRDLACNRSNPLKKTLQHTKHVAPMPEVEDGEGVFTPSPSSSSTTNPS